MKHLPLIIAVFLILAAGFLSSVVQTSITGEVPTNRPIVYRLAPNTRNVDVTQIPTSRYDFNRDGIINKEDVRDHNNVLSRCVDQLWGPFCVPELDIDGNGRYENRDNTILYWFVWNSGNSGESYSAVHYDLTDDCELGRIRCRGDYGYRVCGNYDGDNALEWGPIVRLSDGKECRYGKIVTTEFDVDY